MWFCKKKIKIKRAIVECETCGCLIHPDSFRTFTGEPVLKRRHHRSHQPRLYIHTPHYCGRCKPEVLK
jgi:phage terminase large subunit GpA-like protein